MGIFKRLKQDPEYQSTLKSTDTEENIDLWFYRPLGFAWAKLARRLHITPNVITIASIFLGVGAGVCFYFDNFCWNLLGMFLLVWADSFDSADGQLARMTGNYSRLGRILDGLSGDLWFAAIYVAICLRENVTSDFFMAHHWVIWVMAVVTGICHATQAAMADYYRQLHLFFVKGRKGSELEDGSQLRAKYEALDWKSGFWRKLVLHFYLSYTESQESRTPQLQRLRRDIRERWSGELPEHLRMEFRKKSLPLMKYTNILSFNWRTIALFSAIIIFRMPWLYFAFELTVLNFLLVYMMARHERICREFADRLEAGGEKY